MPIIAAAPAVPMPPRTAPAPASAPSPASSEALDHRGDVSRLQRYASNVPIPLVGSGIQTAYGIREIAAARSTNALTNGAVDAVSGAAGMLNDVSTVTLYASPFLHLPHALTGVAGPINGVTGAIGALLDGGRDLYNSVEHHDHSDAVIGSVKIGAGGVGCLAAFTADLPLNIAMTGVYLGAVIYQNQDSVKSALHMLRHGAGKVADFVRHPHRPHPSSPASGKTGDTYQVPRKVRAIVT